ncbi:MAG TPA: hypothetical protein PKA27_11595, partial [Fimbriimonadaceae bacterium]|nr:hypothetical protein [Fimbriimonadaceae bacterium]
YAPTTVTVDETFMWYQAHPRLQVGLAHLWKQNAVRYLASLRIAEETARTPGINVSAGVQGIGTGNPGYGVTAEKNWTLPSGSVNAYGGVGFRSNESHAHMLGGFKFTPSGSPMTVGLQLDGHAKHPFVTYSLPKGWVVGAYLLDLKSPAIMVGVRF